MGHLVLIGAGHAHLMALEAIPEMVARGHEVTCIGPSGRHYYSGMGPGVLGGLYDPVEISFPVAQMVRERGGRFVRASAVRIDAARRGVLLGNGESIPYDVLSLNAGSGVPLPHGQSALPPDVWTVKPIERLAEARARLAELARERGRVTVLVVGGGPAGVEVAGNVLAGLSRAGGRPMVTLAAGGKLLGRFSSRIRSLAMRSLAKRGISVVEGARLDRLEPGRALFEDGREIWFDAAFLALGVEPSPLARDSGLPLGRSGGLLVDEYLRCPAHPEIFGGGDCIDFGPRPLDKVGVYAVRQNPVLAANLKAALDGGGLTRFDPGADDYLLLFNLGDATAIFRKNGVTFSGRAAMLLKDAIDRRFMRRFGGGA